MSIAFWLWPVLLGFVAIVMVVGLTLAITRWTETFKVLGFLAMCVVVCWVAGVCVVVVVHWLTGVVLVPGVLSFAAG